MEKYFQEAMSNAGKMMEIGAQFFDLGIELCQRNMRTYAEKANESLLRLFAPTPAQAEMLGKWYAYRIVTET